MVTMTIHADEAFAVALRKYAANLGKSVNQTVKDVFAPLLGLARKDDAGESRWSRFVGALPNVDVCAWDRDIAEMRTIDKEMWK